MVPRPPTVSLWSDIAAIVLTPIVVWLISAGWGLLIERAARLKLPSPVSVGVGFCAAVVLALGVFELGVGDAVAVPVVVAPAALGLLWCGRSLPVRLNAGWALVAAVAAYVICDLCVIASGHWTLTFYNIDNDSAYELVLIAHLQAHGTSLPAGTTSTAKTVIQSYIGGGYPLGTQSLCAVVSGLLGVSAAVVWQGFMSAMIGIAALVASFLPGRTMHSRTAAAAATVAVIAALTFQFTLQGSIKEIGTLVGLVSALAVMRHGLVNRLTPMAVVVAVPLAELLAVYNVAGLPYVVALVGAGGVALFALHRGSPGRAWVVPVLSGAAVLVVLAIPALVTLSAFAKVTVAGYAGSHPTAPTLGPLLRRLPLSEINGVWLYGDYRLPVPPGIAGDLTVAMTVLVLVLLAVGAWRSLQRREPAPLMALVCIGLVLLIVYPRITPYAQAKLLAIGSPFVLLGALEGLTGLKRTGARVMALGLGLVLSVTVLASDALAYHVAPPLQTDRMLALEQISSHLPSQAPVLDSEFEQFAKYFAFPTPLVDGPDSPTPIPLQLITPTSEYDQSFDLNQETLSSVESYPYVLTRRSPVASRPPLNYRMIRANAFYELWRREPTPDVVAALPVDASVLAPSARPACSVLRSLVRHAAQGSRLAIWRLPDAYGFSTAAARVRSPGWPVTGSTPTPGMAASPIDVHRRGRYEIWVEGNLTRRVHILLDGRRVGVAQGSNSPGEWQSGGEIDVSSGHHMLEVVRGGGNLAPGDGSKTASLSAVVLAAAVPTPTPRLLPLNRWRRLCGESMSWIEIVAP